MLGEGDGITNKIIRACKKAHNFIYHEDRKHINLILHLDQWLCIEYISTETANLCIWLIGIVNFTFNFHITAIWGTLSLWCKINGPGYLQLSGQKENTRSHEWKIINQGDYSIYQYNQLKKNIETNQIMCELWTDLETFSLYIYLKLIKTK